MQEDKFLEDYRQAWQQDNEEMARIVDIPLETLHENIARYERRKRIRRIVWTTLSAAACLAFAVTTGIHYLTLDTATDSPVLVAENRVKVVPTPVMASQENEPAQTIKFVTPRHTIRKVAPSHESLPQQAFVEEFATIDVTPNAEDESQFSILNSQIPKDANVIETTRLVAMGETQTPAIEVETEGLVNIIEPSRNTFHEAIVEPLLALVTYDM